MKSVVQTNALVPYKIWSSYYCGHTMISYHGYTLTFEYCVAQQCSKHGSKEHRGKRGRKSHRSCQNICTWTKGQFHKLFCTVQHRAKSFSALHQTFEKLFEGQNICLGCKLSCPAQIVFKKTTPRGLCSSHQPNKYWTKLKTAIGFYCLTITS